MTQTTSKNLYDSDFALWIEETVSKLKARKLEQVDWENLIEEVESLGKRDKREWKSRLITLFEHLLKRMCVNSPECYRGWELTIKRTQSKLRDILADSPSLGNFIESIYLDCYQEAQGNMQIEYNTHFPDVCPFPLDVNTLLTKKFC